jgi:hypothetical protein
MLSKINTQKATNRQNSYFKISLSVTKYSLNISISLQTMFAADAYLLQRQVLCEKPAANRRRPLKFRVGARKQIVSGNEEHQFKPL